MKYCKHFQSEINKDSLVHCFYSVCTECAQLIELPNCIFYAGLPCTAKLTDSCNDCQLYDLWWEENK